MAYTLPLFREDNPLGKIVAAFVCLILLGIALLLERHENNHRADAQQAFLKHDFMVVVLYEDDNEARFKFALASEGKFAPASPVARFEEISDIRYLYNLKEDLNIGLPKLKYLQRTLAGSAYIYGVFSNPGASDKIKKWAKDNHYPNWDFPISLEGDTYKTSQVVFKKEGSEVSLVAFFTSEKERLYIWNGSKIIDVSEGITGQKDSAKTEEYYREYSAWLQKLE
jgi:hypothetical protein